MINGRHRPGEQLPGGGAEWIIDILLVGLVLRQIRPRPLTPRSVLFTALLLVIAGSECLTAFPTGGNDVAMDAVLVALGGSSGS